MNARHADGDGTPASRSTRARGRWFTLFLLGLALAFLTLSFSLGRLARLVPLWVLGLTLPLLVLQVLFDWIPSLAARFQQHRDLFLTDRLREQTPAHVAPVAPEKNGALISAMAWVAALPLLVAVAGLAVAVPLHAFLYLIVRARESWLTAVSVSAALAACTLLALRALGG